MVVDLLASDSEISYDMILLLRLESSGVEINGKALLFTAIFIAKVSTKALCPN
ncbi:MAG: hypothetical protein IPP56_05425 [Bacteroidetes bacterium]|nr:hypothetical protein [Bacteroidota bacterium]